MFYRFTTISQHPASTGGWHASAADDLAMQGAIALVAMVLSLFS